MTRAVGSCSHPQINRLRFTKYLRPAAALKALSGRSGKTRGKRARRGWPGWTGRPCANGFTATTRKGLPGSANRPPPGRSPKLSEGQMAALKGWFWPGPTQRWTGWCAGALSICAAA